MAAATSQKKGVKLVQEVAFGVKTVLQVHGPIQHNTFCKFSAAFCKCRFMAQIITTLFFVSVTACIKLRVKSGRCSKAIAHDDLCLESEPRLHCEMVAC